MLTCKASKFSLPRQVTYLNCSYMSPLLKKTEKKGITALRLKRNPVDIQPQDFYSTCKELRAAFARLINVPDPQRIAIIPSVSYGMATVAKNISLKKGGEILIASEQFPSNVYSWRTLAQETGARLIAMAPGTDLSSRGKQWNTKILESINASTQLVAISHTHWADGTKFDLEQIREKTNEVGALLIVDGTQSVGALPFDASRIKPDALICAGYKWLLGPYSLGVAYYGERFTNGKPLEENWISRLKSEDFSALVNYQDEYQPGALRYDAGERSNFILVPMLLDSISQLNRWGVANIQEYCKAISADTIARLREDGFWVEDENFRGSHLFGIRIPAKCNIEEIKRSFLKEKIYVSFRGDAIRVSPNVYNDERDMRKLYKVLRKNLG
jgi:selenocysteine lyase/cysteine desulfurase